MSNILLQNESLASLIKGVRLPEEKKDFLIKKLSQIGEGDRKALLDTLINIYLIDLEEDKVLERLKKFYASFE